MNYLGIDWTQLPVSALTKDTINTAKDHLNKLGEIIKKLESSKQEKIKN